MAHVKKAAHILIFAVTVHAWHLVTSDRMLDAAADVGLDKVATIALQAVKLSGKE
jgi:hypothetical protein